MVAKGQKRKAVEGGGWESQLQCVLDISMDKFLRDQALVEPSLLRSVLISNTLRQVQSEVQAQVESLSQTHLEPDFPKGFPERDAPLLSSNAVNTEDDFMACSSEEDFSLSSAISVILKDLDTVIDAGQQDPSLAGDARLTQHPLSSSRTERTSIKTETAYPGCPQDGALDRLILDINLPVSMFEPEVNLLQGFSITTDDLVKYLPSLSKSPSSLDSHGQVTWDIQEIEHVMDILMRTYPQS